MKAAEVASRALARVGNNRVTPGENVRIGTEVKESKRGAGDDRELRTCSVSAPSLMVRALTR
jgi:hypothetical protein